MIQMEGKTKKMNMATQLTSPQNNELVELASKNIELNIGISSVQKQLINIGTLDFFYEISKKVCKGPESPNLLRQILAMTSKNLKCDGASLFLVDEATGDLYFEEVIGIAKRYIGKTKPKLTHGIAPWVAKNGKPLIVNEVDKDNRFNKNIDDKTGFKTSSILCVPLIVGCKTIGVIEVLNKLDGSNFNKTDLEILTALASTAALTIDNCKLHKMLVDGYENTIKALAATIDAKDPYTFGHSKRVAEYSLLGGMALALSPQDLKIIEYGGILHDIGKIVISEVILRKSTNPTSEEWAIIRTHPIAGARIIADVPFLQESRKIITQHHEKYDGSGYPFGLRGKEISIGARIVAIADAFDTLTTDRSYRSALSIENAINELYRCKGTHFCPIAVEAFISGIKSHSKESCSN